MSSVSSGLCLLHSGVTQAGGQVKLKMAERRLCSTIKGLSLNIHFFSVCCSRIQF